MWYLFIYFVGYWVRLYSTKRRIQEKKRKLHSHRSFRKVLKKMQQPEGKRKKKQSRPSDEVCPLQLSYMGTHVCDCSLTASGGQTNYHLQSALALSDQRSGWNLSFSLCLIIHSSFSNSSSFRLSPILFLSFFSPPFLLLLLKEMHRWRGHTLAKHKIHPLIPSEWIKFTCQDALALKCLLVCLRKEDVL